MAPITVITYKSSVKKKRPWKNINRILSVIQEKEETKQLTAFDALYMKNIEIQKRIKRKVNKRLTSQVEDRKKTTFEGKESRHESTFDRIFAGADLQKSCPPKDKSSAFNSNSSSNVSSCKSYFDTATLTDNISEKTPKTLKKKHKSPKYSVIGGRQLRSCVQLKRHIKSGKNTITERSCLTSTPKGDKENEIDLILSPISPNKTCKMDTWSKISKENISSVNVSNMKDFSLISFKPGICKNSIEINCEHGFSIRKSAVVNKVKEGNHKDVECVVDNEKLYDIIHSFENLSAGTSDVLHASDSCIQITSSKHKQNKSKIDEFQGFTNSDINDELLTNKQTRSTESKIEENSSLHELSKSREDSLILFDSWDSADGSKGKHLQNINKDLEQRENTNIDTPSKIFSHHEFMLDSDVKTQISEEKYSNDDIPLIYLKNKCTEFQKETALELLNENSGKHLQNINKDLEQRENTNIDTPSKIFSHHEFMLDSDVKTQISEENYSNDDIPLIYLKNKCTEFQKETALELLNENSDSCFGQYKLSVQSRKSFRHLSCRRLSHQVVPKQEDIGSHIISSSFYDVYRASRKKSTEYIHKEDEETSIIAEAEYELEQSNPISALVDEVCVPFTAQDAVLQRCCQCKPISFSEAFASSYWETCRKIGEGVYGEVFMSEGEDGSVLKIIPIEGEQLVNGEPQKTFGEILSEIVITMELSKLRYGMENRTESFSEMKRCLCVQGKYPKELMKLWNYYNDEKGSENDSPMMFKEDQLYIILEMANGGQDLEAYVFLSAEQSFSILVQTAYALAVAEQALEFEHRDLHWGNVLISHTSEKEIVFRLCGEEYIVATKGVQVAIIDFTLSRMSYDGYCIYNDLSRDPELFTAEGDYQFEVYRLMQKHTMNIWDKFIPYTNILWLHYLTDKMCTTGMVNYQKKITKSHKQAMELLKDLQTVLLNYNSASDLVLENKMNVI